MVTGVQKKRAGIVSARNGLRKQVGFKGPQIRSNRVAIETQRIPRQVTIYTQDRDESEGAGRKNAKRRR